METLIIHPSSTAQWHALVDDAEQASSIMLPEDLESYLVFLLMRFVEKPEMTQSILADDFLSSLLQMKRERQNSLQDVGDKCLLFAGLFPGLARKRRVKISYYVQLGQTAYSSLSANGNLSFSELYAELCTHFVGLMDILQTMRELNEEQSVIDLLQAQELFWDTKSQHALKVLRKASQSIQGLDLLSPIKPEQKH